MTARKRGSNNAPRVQWQRTVMACETARSRLFVDGKETPYFIDYAAHRAHYTQGRKVGLFGSGMGPVVHTRDGGSYRIAGTLGSWDTIGPAKAAAERMALAEGAQP